MFALAWRLFTALLAFLINVIFPLAQREQFTVTGRTHLFWDTFARYDSGWYWGIARNGYVYVEGGRNAFAFFPLYPKLMHYLGYAMGGGVANYYYAGIIISWAAFVAAMVALYHLARLDATEEQAHRAVVYTAVFPFAFFFGAVYAESVFLLFMVLAVYGFRTKRWLLGGLAGALATASRVNGIVALPAIAWIAYRQIGTDRREWLRAAAALVLFTMGAGSYSLYVYSVSGSPLEWMDSIRRWNYHPGGSPLTPLLNLVVSLTTRPMQYLSEPTAPFDTLNGLAALTFVMATPLVWWRLGAGYGLFMAANLWLPLSSGWYEGLGRYCSVLFPFGILLARVTWPSLHTVILVVFAALYTLCLGLFTKLYPIF